jgi:hypothetical protein
LRIWSWSVAVDRDPFIQAENYDRSAQVIQIDAGKSLATIALCVAALALGVVAASVVFGLQLVDAKAQAATATAIVRANVAEREARLALDKVEELRVEIARR